jgi:hypothetical protein
MVPAIFVDPSSGSQWKVSFQILLVRSEHCFALKCEELLSSFEMEGRWDHLAKEQSNIPFLGIPPTAQLLPFLNGPRILK